MYFNGGRVGSSAGIIQTDYGPFRNENTTYDALANLTKIRGSHTFKAGVYYQHSYKAQSAFASHNSAISFVDDSSNPYDTGFGYANAAIGVFTTYSAGLEVRDAGVGLRQLRVVRSRTTGRPPGGSRSTTASASTT